MYVRMRVLYIINANRDIISLFNVFIIIIFFCIYLICRASRSATRRSVAWQTLVMGESVKCLLLQNDILLSDIDLSFRVIQMYRGFCGWQLEYHYANENEISFSCSSQAASVSIVRSIDQYNCTTTTHLNPFISSQVKYLVKEWIVFFLSFYRKWNFSISVAFS